MKFPELDEAGYFGARGTVSGRTFDPEQRYKITDSKMKLTYIIRML